MQCHSSLERRAGITVIPNGNRSGAGDISEVELLGCRLSNRIKISHVLSLVWFLFVFLMFIIISY